MGFEWLDEGKFHRVPKLEGAPANIYYGDVFSTLSKADSSPLTGSMFLLEQTDKPEPAPLYECDETGVVMRGELHLEDENGKTAKLLPGDTFFIHRGSTILFTTPRYAVAYKVSARHKM
ncbi:Ethanolamine utilization EutQ [Penicillium paradoxum]|uniref:Ethanolamine utilization EutQ n=1 Tax=Penicillium paradoxum TaxID=176176 RepID=UPI002547EBD1|nr:Ethanolamine utilization EutQ [Penicillium paradoxum]KAJ5788312.1 Ethanolamine utilization EutQ [Penicillium paradoxum]